MKTMTRANRARQMTRKRNGQFEAGLDRVCVCGKRLGEHDAEGAHACDETNCEGFKVMR